MLRRHTFDVARHHTHSGYLHTLQLRDAQPLRHLQTINLPRTAHRTWTNTNYGLIGVTTPSSPTGPTSTVPQPTGSTVNTPPLNSPSVTSKKAPGSTTSHQDTTPNCAWLACAVLAHNLGTWTANLAGQPPVTNRTRRTQLTALAAVTVNRSGQPTLRFPARWPWAHQFHQTLSALRALPGPSG